MSRSQTSLSFVLSAAAGKKNKKITPVTVFFSFSVESRQRLNEHINVINTVRAINAIVDLFLCVLPSLSICLSFVASICNIFPLSKNNPLRKT